MAEPKYMNVVCGLPAGIILEVTHAKPEPDAAADKRIPRANPFEGQRYEIPGTNAVAKEQDRLIHVAGKTPFGVGTRVPADFWDYWLKHHEDTIFVKNGLVSAFPTEDAANSEAKSRKGEKSGIDQLDPKDMPKGIEKS